MKTSILLISFILASSISFSKDLSSTTNDDGAIISKLFQRYIKYPSWAKQQKIEATVWVSFDVDNQGKISNISPITQHGYKLEIEALRVLSIINEQHTNTIIEAGVIGHYRLPIRFELQ